MKKKMFLRLCLSVIFAAPFIFSDVHAAPGDLYVSDFGSGTIFRFSPVGTRTTFASGLDAPAGLAFDKSGNLFVAELGPGNILKFTPAGIKSTFAAGLDNPTSLAFDTSGNLFVADVGPGGDFDGAILKFTPAGTKTVFASVGIAFGDLTFNQSGNLFATDARFAFPQGDVFEFTPNGTRTTFISGMVRTGGLAFDSVGNLFAIGLSQEILRFAPNGTSTTFAPPFNQPSGLAFDKDGNLFAGEFSAGNGGRIVKFTPNGSKSTFVIGLQTPLSFAFEPSKETLRNISARGVVSIGDNVLIAGFVLGGNALNNSPVLVRAIGPSLAAHGITNPLKDPVLELHNANGALIGSNNNWQDTQRAQILATHLAPNDRRESAIFATLSAGSYTAIIRGVNNSTGVGLVEIYNLTK
jgi:sugar lactone lactonase YvrE